MAYVSLEDAKAHCPLNRIYHKRPPAMPEACRQQKKCIARNSPQSPREQPSACKHQLPFLPSKVKRWCVSTVLIFCLATATIPTIEQLIGEPKYANLESLCISKWQIAYIKQIACASTLLHGGFCHHRRSLLHGLSIKVWKCKTLTQLQ